MEKQARLVLSFAGGQPDRELTDWTSAGLVAGVVLFSDNFISSQQLKDAINALRQRAPKSLLIMIDEEGGRVRRLPPSISPMPSISSYGETKDTTRAAKDYFSVAQRLRKMGIDTLLAPVVDVRTIRNGWLADRIFSDDPNAVAAFAKQAVDAIQRAGLAACAKHFPGLGGVADDLHDRGFMVADSRQEIFARDLAPFKAAIKAGVDYIMVGHAVYEALDRSRPAVLSPSIINGLLKRHLSFTGRVLTDDLAMGAARGAAGIEKAIERALAAGCDLLLICKNRPLQRRAIQMFT